MADKMWAGRFQKALDEKADDFNSSLRFDKRMYAQDIKGSMAHAAMLGAKNIISMADVDQILAGLQGILDDLDSGALDFSAGGEEFFGQRYTNFFRISRLAADFIAVEALTVQRGDYGFYLYFVVVSRHGVNANRHLTATFYPT